MLETQAVAESMHKIPFLLMLHVFNVVQPLLCSMLLMPSASRAPPRWRAQNTQEMGLKLKNTFETGRASCSVTALITLSCLVTTDCCLSALA